MQHFELNNSNQLDPIKVDLITKDPKEILIFICGSGDNRESFHAIIKKLDDQNFSKSLLSFSFRGRESDNKYPYSQLITDFRELLDYLISEGFNGFTLVATSAGFVNTADVVSNPKYKALVKQIILLDPADYHTDPSKSFRTWSGDMVYAPDDSLFSDMYKNLDNKTRVDLIFFTLRNYKPGVSSSSRTYEEMGIDNKDFFTRLNRDMAVAIFDKVPEVNQGKFIDDDLLPHAMKRDGNVERNQDRVVEYILELTPVV